MYNRETFVLYDTEMFTGQTEVLDQATIDLNSSANGVMSIVTEHMRGDFLKESFFKDIDGLVRDRDPNDTTEALADDLTMGEAVSPKVFKYILVEKTLNAFYGLGETPQVMSFAVGQIQGKRMAADYLNTGIAAVSAALRSEADVTYDASATADRKTISPQNLNRIKKRLGDAAGRIRAWVMDATMYHDLVEENIDANITNVAGAVVYGASPATLGLPVIVTDSPSLIVEDGGGVEPDQHYVLALVEGAVELIESDDRVAVSEVVSGRTNLMGRIQNEGSYLVKVSNASWGGGSAPTTAELGDPANWTYTQYIKNGPGAIGIFNAIDEA